MRYLLPEDDEAKLRYLEAWVQVLDTDVIRLRQRLPQTPDHVGVPLTGPDTITIVQPPYTTTTTTTAAPTTTTTTPAPTTTTTTPAPTTTTTAAPTTTTTTTTTTTLGVTCTSALVVTGDVAIANWRDTSGGTTNLYAAIDETIAGANDSDYIRLSKNNVSQVAKFSRTTGIGGTAVLISSVTVKLRMSDAIGLSQFTVSIYKSGGATLLGHGITNTVGTSFTDITWTLSLDNTTPSNWANIELWITATTPNSGSKSDYLKCSAAEIVICYTAP